MTEAKVVPLRSGLAPPPGAVVNPELVEKLADLLEKAKAGEVVGLAYAVLHPGDLSTYDYRGRTTRGLLGALLLLQHHMCSADIENQ